MKLWSLFTGVFKSETYRNVRSDGGFFIGYAILIVLLCTFAVTVYYSHFIHREVFTARDGKPAVFDDVVKQIAAQMPTMALQDNQLMSNDAAPTTIKLSGTAFGMDYNDIALITIDTSGQTMHETMQTPILITNKDVIFKTKDKTEIKSIAEITKDLPSSMIINRAMIDSLATKTIEGVRDSLTSIYLIFGGIAWFFIAAYMAIMRLFMLLALGLAGLLIGSLAKSPIKYAPAVGLASVSYMPIAMLDTILFTGLHYPTSTIVLFAGGCVALFAAIKCSHTAPPRQLVG